MLGQTCLLEIIQMEKKRGKNITHTHTHFRSLAFLNRPPAIFTPPEIAQSHEIKPCSVKPAKQKDNLQAGTLTESPLFASPDQGLQLPDSPGHLCPNPAGHWGGGGVGSRSHCLGDPPGHLSPPIIWEGGRRVESRAVTRMWRMWPPS